MDDGFVAIMFAICMMVLGGITGGCITYSIARDNVHSDCLMYEKTAIQGKIFECKLIGEIKK